MIVNPHLIIEPHQGRHFAYNTLTGDLNRLSPVANLALACQASSDSPEEAFGQFHARVKADQDTAQKHWQALLGRLAERNMICPQPQPGEQFAPAGVSALRPPLNTELVRAYHVLGCAGQVSSNNSQFLDAFHAEHQHYGVEPSTDPSDFQIHCQVEETPSWEVPDGAVMLERASEHDHYQSNGHHFFDIPSAQVLWQVDYASGTFVGTAPNPAVLLEQARIFFEVAVTQTLAADKLAFHGSVVSRDGFGLVLLGDSGHGKSTLAWALAEKHGFALVADDTFFYAPESGRVHGYLPHLALPLNGADAPYQQYGQCYQYLCGLSRVLIPAQNFPMASQDSCPLTAFIILRQTNQLQSSVAAAQGEPAHMLIPRLMAPVKCFWRPAQRYQDTPQRRLRALLDMSVRARGFGLFLGSDVDKACQCVSDLAQKLGDA